MKPMQINTEPSPMVSPKSILSISSISPKDHTISHFGSNKHKILYGSNDNKKYSHGHSLPIPDFENSNRNCDSATNESFSIDRFTNDSKF